MQNKPVIKNIHACLHRLNWAVISEWIFRGHIDDDIIVFLASNLCGCNCGGKLEPKFGGIYTP